MLEMWKLWANRVHRDSEDLCGSSAGSKGRAKSDSITYNCSNRVRQVAGNPFADICRSM